MANNILIVAFEVGVVKGFENVRSAHIQVPYKLAMDLDKKGHSTALVTNLNERKSIPPEMSHIPIKYISDPRKRNKRDVMYVGHSNKISIINAIKALFQLIKIIKKESASVVHFTHGSLGVGLFASVISILINNTKVVWTPSEPFQIRSSIFLYLLNKINEIVCSTEYMGNHFSGLGIRNSVIKHGSIRELKIEKKRKDRITFWRDPSYENGADIAFGVFKKLAIKYPKIKFTIMIRPHWDSLIAESDLSNIEIYRYPYPKKISLEEVLSETIACYFPFRKLSTNPQLCILESVTSGLPCFVSNIESIPEYVIDKEYIIQKNTIEEGVQKIDAFLGSSPDEITITNPKNNGFHWKNFINNYLEIYFEGEKNDLET